MKLNNTTLYVLMGLLLGTAGANADECTSYQMTQGCVNLTVNYKTYDPGGDWMSATYTPCQPASPGATTTQEVPTGGATYCVQHYAAPQPDTTVAIGPHSTNANWTQNQTIGYGLTATCYGWWGENDSGCDIVETPPSAPEKAINPKAKPVNPPAKPVPPKK